MFYFTVLKFELKYSHTIVNFYCVVKHEEFVSV